MNIKLLEIGSFNIFKSPCSLGSVYIVSYNPEHQNIFTWHFINNYNKAHAFAKQKTKIDKKRWKVNK